MQLRSFLVVKHQVLLIHVPLDAPHDLPKPQRWKPLEALGNPPTVPTVPTPQGDQWVRPMLARRLHDGTEDTLKRLAPKPLGVQERCSGNSSHDSRSLPPEKKKKHALGDVNWRRLRTNCRKWRKCMQMLHPFARNPRCSGDRPTLTPFLQYVVPVLPWQAVDETAKRSSLLAFVWPRLITVAI